MENDFKRIRLHLLELHRILIDTERQLLEREQGEAIAPAQLLQLLIEDSRFAWLRPMSQLIVQMDEALADARKAKVPFGAAAAEPVLREVRALLAPSADLPDFAARYLELMRTSPTVQSAHRVMEALMAPFPPR